MNIHEYQAKELLQKFGVRVQRGIVASTEDEAFEAAKKMNEETGTGWYVVKAQIHAGGRGKGKIKGTEYRGVMIAKSQEDAKTKAGQILGGTLVTLQTGEEGKLVNKVLIAEDVYYPGASEPKEFYVSVMMDRNVGKNMIIASTEGGMNIEEVAKETPHLIISEWVDPATGLMPFQTRKLAFKLGLSGQAHKEMCKFLHSLYTAFVESDAAMFEINPALKTSDDKIMAVDAKVSFDDNALYRHPDFAGLRDTSEESPLEVEASKYDLNYIKLDGNVGCMVNGAGLAMATMDIISLSGGQPANFLDVGGKANAETVEKAFRIILQDPKVKAILINIFGGIVRCDRVANGVVEAYKKIGSINVPIIVRLQGTNAEEAAEIIKNSGLNVIPATLLKDAAERITEVLN